MLTAFNQWPIRFAKEIASEPPWEVYVRPRGLGGEFRRLPTSSGRSRCPQRLLLLLVEGERVTGIALAIDFLKIERLL